MKFSVVIPMIFQHLPLTEGLKKADEAGMKNAEIMGWYNEDLNELKSAIDEWRMEVVLLSTKSYQLADSNQHRLFINGLSRTIEAAKLMKCSHLFCIVGDEMPGVPRNTQRNNIISVLKESARMVEQSNMTLNIEPLNIKVDHPGYFLYSSDEAFEIVKNVGSPNIKVLFDIYHQQITEGDLIRRITKNLEYIGHFHAAGNPGRHEITTGEIHYPNIFNELDKCNYQGYVGLEYIPCKDPVKELQELKAFYSC